MPKLTLDEENLLARAGIADRDFADHSGNIQQGYELGSLTRGLVAYYPMEEGQGQVLHDGALDNLGNFEDSPSWTTGNIGSNALSFDGSNDAVSINYRDFIATGTISFWIKTSDTSASDPYGAVATGDNDPRQVFTLNSDSTGSNVTGAMGFDLYDENGNRLTSHVDNDTGVIDGNWHNVTITFEGPDNEILYFIDGSVQTTTQDTQENPESVGTFDNNPRIGAKFNNGSVDGYYNGDIDDFRIYDRRLSKPEIDALVALTSPSGFEVTERDTPTLIKGARDKGGAISRYEFENDVTDSWGQLDATNNGATFVDGVYGQAADFGGTSDNIVAPGSSIRPVLNSGQYAISLWIKSSDTNVATASVLEITASSGLHGLQFNATENGEVRYFDGGTSDQLEFTDTSVTNNEWHNIVAVVDAFSDNRQLYMDGVIRDSGTKTYSNQSASDLYIGSRTDSTDFFQGQIDDVRIYDRALDPIEAERLYNKGAYRINRGEL